MRGYLIFMKDQTLSLRDQDNKLVQVEMIKNRMFKLNLVNIRAKCLKDNMEDEAWLWHLWFEHLNFGALKLIMATKEIMHGLPTDYSNKFCEGYALGKQARTSFPKEASYGAKEPLELVHTDICAQARLYLWKLPEYCHQNPRRHRDRQNWKYDWEQSYPSYAVVQTIELQSARNPCFTLQFP